MTGFTKLASGLVTSTIWSEDDKTRILWVTLLAVADQHGQVEIPIPGLAKLCGYTIPEIEESMAKLMAPDPYSSSKEEEGRRVVELDDGTLWLVTHSKYREKGSSDEKKEKARQRVKRYRERARAKSAAPDSCNADETPCNAGVTPCNADETLGNACYDKQKQKQRAEAEAEANSETEEDEEEEASSSSSLANRPDAMKARIRNLSSRFLNPPTWTHAEDRALFESLEAMLSTDDAVWSKIEAWSKERDEKSEWPHNRKQFCESFADVVSRATSAPAKKRKKRESAIY